MKAAVVVFPGSNCDRDCKTAIERSTGASVDMVWHAETELPAGLDLSSCLAVSPMATICAPAPWRPSRR